jgi:gluconokinase
MITRVVIVMGVAGCGKTTVGKSLAKHLGWDFYDADNFHPAENIAKMINGIPLNDADRSPWLASLRILIFSSLIQNRPSVLACSALKESYRQQMLAGNDDAQIVFLKGNYDLIWSRLSMRKDHYMKPQMLQSQLETLEEPTNALTVDISKSVNDIVQEILKCLKK